MPGSLSGRPAPRATVPHCAPHSTAPHPGCRRLAAPFRQSGSSGQTARHHACARARAPARPRRGTRPPVKSVSSRRVLRAAAGKIAMAGCVRRQPAAVNCLACPCRPWELFGPCHELTNVTVKERKASDVRAWRADAFVRPRASSLRKPDGSRGRLAVECENPERLGPP
jgi:hypothetical protein